MIHGTQSTHLSPRGISHARIFSMHVRARIHFRSLSKSIRSSEEPRRDFFFFHVTPLGGCYLASRSVVYFWCELMLILSGALYALKAMIKWEEQVEGPLVILASWQRLTQDHDGHFLPGYLGSLQPLGIHFLRCFASYANTVERDFSSPHIILPYIHLLDIKIMDTNV